MIENGRMVTTEKIIIITIASEIPLTLSKTGLNSTKRYSEPSIA